MAISINVGAKFNARDLRTARRELDALARQAETTSGRMRRLGDSMQTAGRRMSGAGRTMTRSITAPLAAIGGIAVKSAADFETSFAKIRGLVGVSAEEIGVLEEAASRLGPQFGKSSNEAAEALFFITSAGLRGKDAIEALEVSLQASAVGLGEVATIADLTTSIMNAYGSETVDAAKATDVLTAAVREGKLEPEELAGAMGQVLPIASAMGISVDEVGATFAAMSRTGTDASQAATQLRGIMTGLLKPTAEAERALAEMGMSSKELRDQIRERGLLSVLERLTEAFAGNEEGIAEVFGNVRALSGVLDLMGSNVEGTRQIFENMTDTTGILNSAFSATADTAAFQFQQALAELRETLRKLGEDIMPFVQRLVDGLRNLVDRFNELSPAQQDLLIKFGAVLAIAGPILLFLGSLATAIGVVTVALAGMSTAMIVATGGLVLLGAAIGLAVWSNAAQDTDSRARALELEAEAADHAAAGYHAMAEARYAEAAAMRARLDQQAHETSRFQRMAEEQRATRAEQEAAAEAARLLEEATAAMGDAVGGATDNITAAGPKVVALTGDVRDLLRELNDMYVGTSDAGDAIAQFSREVLAAGNITDETVRAAERLAQVVRQDIDQSLAEGNRRLDEATQKLEAYRDAIADGIRRGNTIADAFSAQSTALDELTRAEQEYEAAQASGDPERLDEAEKALDEASKSQKTFLGFLQVGVDSAQGFAAQIDALREAGASLEVVQQIAELGARSGGRIASELLAGGEAAIRQTNRMVEAVTEASRRAGEAAAQQFFGAGVNAARSFIAAIEDTIPELQGVLDRIADVIARAMGTRPDVSLTGERRFIQPAPPTPAPSVTTIGGAVADESWVRGGAAQIAAIRAVPMSAFDNFTVPGLADGGLVTRPTLAMIGEAGPEVAIPLDRLGGMGATINVTVTSADPEAVVEAIRRYTRNNGPLGQVISV